MNNFCEKCGVSKARNVETEAKKAPRFRCYECHREEEDRKFHHAERVLSPAEQEYAEAKKIYILKPQFHGEQPDYESFQKAADKYTTYELAELKRQRNTTKTKLNDQG